MTEDQRDELRQQMQNMSEDERATRRAQFSGQAGGPAAGAMMGTTRGLVTAVTSLLARRGGVAVERTHRVRPTSTATLAPTRAPSRVTETSTPAATAAPTPTATPEQPAAPTETPSPAPSPEPVVYVVRAGDALAAIAQAYGVSMQAIVEANDIADADRIEPGQELLIPDPAQIPTTVGQPGGSAAASGATPVPALEQIEDTDPGPPFTVQVSANRAAQDPLVEKSRTYLVTGIVRNHGDKAHALSALHVTFYDAEGFRGTFRKAPVPWRTGGEWLWHGQTDADMAALLLAPGEEWPFSVRITAQDMASFLIHPDAAPTERVSMPVRLGGLWLRNDGTGYVRITGTATNENAFKVKNVTLSGVLIDGSGQIVSLGSTYVLQEDVAPGESVRFDLRIARAPYVRYQLYAQAERDWD